MINFSKLILILGLLYNLSACQQNSEDAQENTETSDKLLENEDINTKDKVSKNLKVDASFGAYRWYKGMLDEKIPIWVHIRGTYEGSSGATNFTAYYGYNSQRGKAIQLSGEYQNAKLKMELFMADYKESFEAELDSETGTFKGTWTNSKKKMSFFLEPTLQLPLNFEGFLTQLSQLKPPVSLSEMQYPSHYQTQQYEFYLPNLQKFVPSLAMGKPEGVMLGKYQLDSGDWLVLFRYEVKEEQYAGAYTENEEESYGAAVFDNKGKCLAAEHLGNYGSYLDFSLILQKDGNLLGEWIYMGRGYNPDTNMSATMIVGGREVIWQVQPNKESFEVIKDEEKTE